MKPSAEIRTGLITAMVCLVTCIGRTEQVPEPPSVAPVEPSAIERAVLEHNRSLQWVRLEADAATAVEHQADAMVRPQIDVEARASHFEGLEDSTLGPALSLPFIEDRYSGSITASQPLWTGGRASAKRDGARHSLEAAREKYRAGVADVRRDALTAYWSWSKAFDAERTWRAAVTRTEAHAADMRNLQAAGLATENDRLATEVLLDQMKLHLEDAHRRTEVARARLVYLTGAPLPENAVPCLAAEIPASEESPVIAPAPRAEHVAQEREVSAAGARVEAARAEAHPQVLFSARYEYARPNLLTIPPHDRWDDDVFVGLVVAWRPFDSGLTRHRIAEAGARAAQARIRLEDLDARIMLEKQEADIGLREALARMTVAARAVESARRNLTAATDLWNGGLARHADVLDAQSSLATAEGDLVAARADVILARIAVDHAAGRLDAPAAPRP